MLCLDRDPNDGKSVIKIGDSITVTVVRVRGDRVRVGVDAPADVPILRGEIQPRAPGMDEHAA